MKGAGFLGVVLVAFGVLLAYLYASGKWPAIWALIIGQTSTSAPATSTPGVAGQTSFGSYANTGTATTTPSNGIQLAATPSATLTQFATVSAPTFAAYPSIALNV